MFNTFAINVAAPLVPVVVKVIASCLPLKVDQLALDKAPLLEALAVGKLNVWTVPADDIAKSVPLVPVTKVWAEPVNKFNAVMPVPANIPACCVTVIITEAADGGGLPAA